MDNNLNNNPVQPEQSNNSVTPVVPQPGEQGVENNVQVEQPVVNPVPVNQPTPVVNSVPQQPINNVQPQQSYTQQSVQPMNNVQPQQSYTQQSVQPMNNVQPQQGYPQQPVQPMNNVQPQQGYPYQSVQPMNSVQPQQGYPQQPVSNGFNNQYSTQYNGNVWGTGNYYNNNQYVNNNGYNQKPKADNKLKVVAAILLVVLIGFLIFNFTTKKDNSASPHKNTDYERTIMIYMVGADLESNSGLATLDLNGLDYNKLKAQSTKVIVIAGGSNSWKNNYIDINSTSIYELTESGYKVVKKQSRKNMGESAVLSEFLNYGFDNYKSKKYDLMFWNHGLGVLGSEHDEVSDDFLSLKEINAALKSSRFSKKNKLELVLFRTCLNGTIEVADTLKDYSDYMVASQEVTLGYSGNNVLKTLNTTVKTDNGKQVGTKFADGYMSYIQQYITSSGVYSGSVYSTYSVLDLSKMDELENALEDFFGDIDVSRNYTQIARVRATLKQYGSSDATYDSVDLYSLVEDLKPLSPAKGQKVLDCLNKVVVHNVASDYKSKGLSVYFPYNGSAESKKAILNNYYDFSGLNKYKSFITTFNNNQTSGSTGVSFMDNKITLDSKKDSTKADFSLELTDEQKKNYAKAGYIVFRKEKDGKFVPIYSSTNVKLEGNTLNANIKGRQLKIVDKTDKSESVITLIEKEETNDYIRYETYAILEDLAPKEMSDWLFHNAKMDIYLNKKTNKVTIGGTFIQPSNTKKDDGSKKNDSKKVVDEPYNVAVDYKKYSHIVVDTTAYDILDKKGNYNKDWTSNGSFKGYETKVKNMSLEYKESDKKADYYAVFKIYDVNNNEYYSKLVKMK